MKIFRWLAVAFYIAFAVPNHAQDFGNALHFDGTNDYVALPAGAAFNTADFTFEAWVRWDGPASNWQRVFDFGSGTNNYMFLTPQNSVNGKPRFAIRTATVGEQIIDGNVTIVDGNWHHLAISLDDAANRGVMYIDGAVAGTNNAVTLRPLDLGATPNNWIGRSQFADPYFKGAIDEVKIWNVARTMSQIQNYYTDLTGTEFGLTSFYKFNTGTAGGNNAGQTTLTSTTTSSLNGTLNNFALTGATSNWIRSLRKPNFPVIEDFESGQGEWTTGGTNNTWAFGTPAKPVINGAHSGSKAWIPGGLTGSYGDNELSWVQSPVYNFANAVNPVVSLWIWRECESSWDGAILQQSINGGNWTTVGTFGDPNNWYNHSAIYSLSSVPGWTGRNDNGNGSNGWVYASHALSPSVVGQSNVQFRILWGSDGSIVDDGFAFDDFSITMDRYPINVDVTKADFGNELDFDGANDFVILPVDTLRETQNGFTIETWVKWGTGNSNPFFYAGNDWSDYFLIGNTGLSVVGTNSNNGNDWTVPITAISDNNWHHMAVTIDNIKNIGIVYVDGVVSGSFSSALVITLRELGGQLRHGSLGRDMGVGGNYNYFKGRLDDFRIWNYPRTQKQITLSQYLPASSSEPGLIYYLDFNEGIPSGTNTSISFLEEGVSGSNADILGFGLVTSTSNFVRTTIPRKANAPKITSIAPTSAKAGQKATIYGGNFGPTTAFNKVLVGTREATILSLSAHSIEFEVPTGVVGPQKVSVFNSNGGSFLRDFTVISELSALDFSFERKDLYSQLLGPRSLAPIDFDGDSYMDIVLAGKGQLILMRNNGGNSFTTTTIAASQNAQHDYLTIGDLDQDGDQDIICYQYPDIIWLRNNGNATWTRFVILSNSELYNFGGDTQQGAILLADLDLDGDLDIITRKQVGIGWLSNDGTGGFPGGYVNIENTENYLGLAVGDLDGDKDIDIAAATNTWGGLGSNEAEIHAFINSGNASSFAGHVVGSRPHYGDMLNMGDFNGDGKFDIITGNWNGPTRIFIGLGSNTYGTYNVGDAVHGHFDLGDLNGDGNLDIASTSDLTLSWLMNNGTGQSFVSKPIASNLYTAMDVKAVDLDNDGDLDLISASRDNNRFAAYMHLFSDTDFESFELDDQVSPATPDAINHSIDITIKNATSLTKLTPKFVSSLKAGVFVNQAPQTSEVTSNDFTGTDNKVTYTIIAEDKTQQDWTVRVHPLPASPVLNTITTITQGGASINWTNGTFTDSNLLDVSTDNFVTFVTNYEQAVVTGASFALTGLLPGVAYQVRIKGNNSYGSSEAYSNVLTFTTVPGTPALSTVANVSQTSATVSWAKVTGATSYLVDVSKDNFSTFTQPYSAFEVTSSNVTLNGLETGTQYQLRIRSSNQSGSSTNSNIASFVTIPSNPLATAATVVGTNSFVANWSIVQGATSYLLDKSTDNFTSTPETVAGITSNSLTIEELVAGNRYGYRVRAVNSSGLISGYSNIITINTLPVAPSLDEVTSITQNSASLSWQPSNGASSYQLDLSKDNFSSFVQPYNNFNVITGTHLLVDLTPGTVYQFRIRAANASGTSPNFATSTFTTIPPAPVAQDPTSRTSTSFTANWNNTPAANSYTIEISDNNFASMLETRVTDQTSASFNGLTLGKPYVYRVRAANNSGSSGNSNAIQVVPAFSVTITNQSIDATSKMASLTAVSAAGIDSVKLFFRGIASGNYKSINVPVKTGTTYEAAITSDMEDELGTEYYFQVKDGLADKRNGEISYHYRRLDGAQKEKIPFARFGRGASNYTLFSIPYTLDDQNIESVFDPVLGGYDDTKWRLIRYQDGRNVDYGDGLNKLEPGKGYWFASLQEAEIHVGSASTVRANRSQPYTLELLKGWNQIGNPFPFDVSWADVLTANAGISGVGRLFTFDGGGFKKGDLRVWGGGFVRSERDVSMKIPVTVSRTTTGRVLDSDIENGDLGQQDWIVPLHLSQGSWSNDLAAIGMHPDASISNDEFDEQSLPRFINYLELNSYHPEYFLPRFMRDIVPSLQSYSWEFEVESNLKDEIVTLSWDPSSMGYNDAQLFLYDAQAAQLVDMKKGSSYSFGFKGKRKLAFFYGVDRERFAPRINAAGAAFPNPFSSQTTIPFLASQGNESFSCTVYDLTGREIKSLTPDHLRSGYNEVLWDGTDKQGARVATGVYLYRVSFGQSPVQTGRILFK